MKIIESVGRTKVHLALMYLSIRAVGKVWNKISRVRRLEFDHDLASNTFGAGHRVVYCSQLPSSLSMFLTLFFILVVFIGVHGDGHGRSLLLTCVEHQWVSLGLDKRCRHCSLLSLLRHSIKNWLLCPVIVPPTPIFIKKGGRNDGGHLIRLGPLTPHSALDSLSTDYCDCTAFSSIGRGQIHQWM